MTYPASFSKDELEFFTAYERVRAKPMGDASTRKDEGEPGPGSPAKFIPGIYTKPKLVEPVLEWWA